MPDRSSRAQPYYTRTRTHTHTHARPWKLQRLCKIKHLIEGEASRIAQQRSIEGELPARVPGKEDPEIIDSESGDDEWEGGDAKPAGSSTIDTTTG